MFDDFQLFFKLDLPLIIRESFWSLSENLKNFLEEETVVVYSTFLILTLKNITQMF